MALKISLILLNVFIGLHIMHNHILVNIRFEIFKKSNSFWCIWHGINMLICRFGNNYGIETVFRDRNCGFKAFLKYLCFSFLVFVTLVLLHVSEQDIFDKEFSKVSAEITKICVFFTMHQPLFLVIRLIWFALV